MSNSLLNYQFFKSYRLPLDVSDKVELHVKSDSHEGHTDRSCSVESINLTGLNFTSTKSFKIGEEINLHIVSKSLLNMWDFPLRGKIVRSFINEKENNSIIYGVILEGTHIQDVLNYFLKSHVSRFNNKKIKEHLFQASTVNKNINTSAGAELFSLFQSISKDIYTSGIDMFLADITKTFHCNDYHIYLMNETKRTLGLYKTNSSIDLIKTKERANIELSAGNNIIINMSYANKDSQKEETENVLIYPFYNRLQKPIGVIVLSNTLSKKPFDTFAESSIRFVSQIISHFFKDHMTSIAKEKCDHEIRYDSILGTSRTSIELKQNLELLKNMDKNIMIIGEYGVNKKEIADYLHYEGKLKNSFKKFYQLTTIESVNNFFSELDNITNIETGSLIIKEVHLLSSTKQQQLYEFLKDKQIRVTTLTSRDIYHLVKVGKFNKKLYFLLNDINIHIPPLRNRNSDILEIAQIMLDFEHDKRKQERKPFSKETVEKITTYTWPGNIKELRNKIKKAVIKSTQSDEVTIDIAETKHEDNMTPLKNNKLFSLLKSLTKHSDKCINYKEHTKTIKYYKKIG